jgi:hypothetical protein
MRMAQLVKQHLSAEYEIVNLFSNTTWEDEDTLRFLDAGDRHFGLNLVWVEAEINPGEGVGTTHRVVTYETAGRKGEAFEAMCAKYGVPNKTFKHCTRELKLRPMTSYIRSIGWEPGSYFTAIGIRPDEKRRVSLNAGVQKILYPLIDMWPHDKSDVIAFFEDIEWDLRIEEYEGNCLGCYKKSDRKLNTLWRRRPEVFNFPIRLDQLYAHVGPNNVPGPRKMYRGLRTPQELVAEFQLLAADTSRSFNNADAGTCSESCEVYETVEDII